MVRLTCSLKMGNWEWVVMVRRDWPRKRTSTKQCTGLSTGTDTFANWSDTARSLAPACQVPAGAPTREGTRAGERRGHQRLPASCLPLCAADVAQRRVYAQVHCPVTGDGLKPICLEGRGRNGCWSQRAQNMRQESQCLMTIGQNGSRRTYRGHSVHGNRRDRQGGGFHGVLEDVCGLWW